MYSGDLYYILIEMYNFLLVIGVFIVVLFGYHHITKFLDEMKEYKTQEDKVGKISYSVLVIVLCLAISYMLLKSQVLIITVLGK